MLQARTRTRLPSQRELLLPIRSQHLSWSQQLSHSDRNSCQPSTDVQVSSLSLWAAPHNALMQPFKMIATAFSNSLVLMQNCSLKAITENQEKSRMLQMNISILQLGKAAAEAQQTLLAQQTHRQSYRQQPSSQLWATCSCQTLAFLKSFWKPRKQ